MHIPVLVRDVWRIVRRLLGSRRAIAALVLGVLVFDCSDAILDHAMTAAASTSVAGARADAPINARDARPSHLASAAGEKEGPPLRTSVPASRAPHAPCPCASAVPLTPAPELPQPAMRDNASRPEPGDFALPHGPSPERRLRPPVALLG